jgi:hypothetical protein
MLLALTVMPIRRSLFRRDSHHDVTAIEGGHTANGMEEA